MVRVHKLCGVLSVSSPWIQYWVTPRIEVGAFADSVSNVSLYGGAIAVRLISGRTGAPER